MIGYDQGFTLAELGLDAAAPLALAAMLEARARLVHPGGR